MTSPDLFVLQVGFTHRMAKQVFGSPPSDRHHLRVKCEKAPAHDDASGALEDSGDIFSHPEKRTEQFSVPEGPQGSAAPGREDVQKLAIRLVSQIAIRSSQVFPFPTKLGNPLKRGSRFSVLCKRPVFVGLTHHKWPIR